jgi:6-phosphogluconate dehydrogenase
MQLGMVGLGRMGMNMARRLVRGGHQVIAYNRTPEKIRQIEQEGARGAYSPASLVNQLAPPRIIWLMLPAGSPVDEHLALFAKLLSPGDIIVDGGNTYYKDDIRRSAELKARGIHYVDAGVSGGVWGLANGYCTMVGGEEDTFRHLEPLLAALAPRDGYLYCGPAGAGHFVKMVHNGIEYALMAAYGEGFNIIKKSPYGEQLALDRIARLWNQGSVVRSWLLELLEAALRKDPGLAGLQPYVEDSGEGRWTVQQAIETGAPAPVITLALFQRFESRREDSFTHKVLAALRREFGGHQTLTPGKDHER